MEAVGAISELGYFWIHSPNSVNNGNQRERAGRGSLMTYTQVIYAVFWDVVLFHHWPNIWTWCGMAVIVSSTIWVINMRASKQNVVATAELLSTSDFELDDLED